jgi:aspartyl-tRNA(Asn)/glutamyl-tRNA(Gln) amidotransferase subunit B
MRSKELSDDYRYFPDPDLLPVRLTPELIEQVRATLPELPAARRHRYVAELGLSPYDAQWLAQDPDVAGYFDAAAGAAGDAKLAANWVMGELAAALNRAELGITRSPVSPARLAVLITRLKDGTLSSKTAKTLFEALWTEDGDVDAIIDARGLRQVSDTGALAAIVTRVVADNPAQVAEFRAGKEKVLGFLVGQVMKATQGKANPQQVNQLLREALKTP